MREFLKIVGGILLGLAAAALIALNVVLLWVSTGPRSLNTLSPYIAASLRPPGATYSVKIGQTWLVWEGWQHPVDIRLKQVTVLTRDGQVFSRFPEISLGVDIFSLPMGHIVPTSLTINHPAINLFQNDDRSISFGISSEEQPPPETPAQEPGTAPFSAALALLLHPDPNGNLRKLHNISILGADVSVGNHKGVFFKASDVNIVFRRNRKNAAEISTSAKIAYSYYQSSMSTDFEVVPGDPVINGRITFDEFMPGTLAALFADNRLLNAFKVPVSGKAELKLNMAGVLEKLDFTVEGGHGSIDCDRLDASLPVTSIYVDGTVGNNFGDLTIRKFTVDLNGMLLEADGTGTLTENPAIHGHLVLRHIPVNNLHLLWPPEVSKNSREWVTTNISEGTVPQAEATIAIAPGDLAKPDLPREDINASIRLEGAKIRYLPDHPEVRDIRGVIHIDGVSLQADIASGEYLKDTKLTGGKLVIDDLNADNPYIKLNFNAEASAKDIVRVLGLPRLKHAARLGLDETTAEGSAKGNISLGFNFYAPRDADGNPTGDADIAYDIHAELKDVSQPGFMKKFDIKNANGAVSVNPTGIEFKGKGEVNGASVSDGDVRYLFKPEQGLDTFIDVTGMAPVEAFPRFGYPKFPFLKGTVGVKASVKEGDNTENSQATFDLTHATVSFPDYGWIKPDKEPATFDLTAEKKDGAVHISSFHLKGRDMESKGSIDLSKDMSDIQRITMEPLRFGNTDLDRMMYEVIDGGWHIEAKGKSADMTAWLAPNPSVPSTFSFAHFPAFRLQAQVDRLILGKDRELSAVKATVDCTVQLCRNVDASGKTVDGKPFTFRMQRNARGVRQLAIRAASAGAYIKALGILDGMEGGELTVSGDYNDSTVPGTLKGRLDITEHTIKNAPILARILSVASLTGIFDTLRGKGISFDKLHALFTLSNDVITIKDAKTHGDAMGMTAAGTITFPRRMLDIEGTIIPSYSLNHVLGNVPLVGHVLTGSEGGGIFAARYHVTGPYNNPDVSVNPLSMLTPGFLRGVFDIFDSKGKDEEE